MGNNYNIYYDDNEIMPLADDLVICFSEFLKDKGIMFVNDETDMHQFRHKSAIYGEDFRNLQERVQKVLDDRLKPSK